MLTKFQIFDQNHGVSPLNYTSILNVQNCFFPICFHDLLHGNTGGYKGRQGVTRGYRGLQGVTGSYKGLQEVTRRDRGLQGVTGGLKRLQRVTGALQDYRHFF